ASQGPQPIVPVNSLAFVPLPGGNQKKRGPEREREKQPKILLVENQPANLLRQVEKEKDPADRQRDEDELCEPADEAAQFAGTNGFFDLHILMFFPGSVQPRLLFTDLLQSRVVLSRPVARFFVKLDRPGMIRHGKICERL